MQDLSKLLKLLLEEEIDFVLIGGFAAVVYGSTLVTQDLDVCLGITDKSVEQLRKALSPFNPKHRMNPKYKPSFLDEPKSIDNLRNIYLETDLGILDILSETLPAGDFESLASRAIEVPLYGFKCKVISIDDLILVKETMKRPKDLQAVEELRKIKDLKEL